MMKCIIAQKRMRMVVMLGEQQEPVRRNRTTENTLFIYDRTKQGYSIKGVHSVRYFGTYLTFVRIANRAQLDITSSSGCLGIQICVQSPFPI